MTGTEIQQIKINFTIPLNLEIHYDTTVLTVYANNTQSFLFLFGYFFSHVIIRQYLLITAIQDQVSTTR